LPPAKFYGNMVWGVDGSRLKRDLPRFAGGTDPSRRIVKPGLYLTPFPDEVFSRSWLSCSVPVLFDFESAADGAQEIARFKRPLWCLLPGRVHGRAVVLQVSRDSFVRWVHDRAQPVAAQAILRAVANALAIEHQERVRECLRAVAARQRQPWRRIPSRRF
jgi:competence protein CoiA